MTAKTYDRSVFLAWRGNAHKHINLHFKNEPEVADGYRARVDAIDITGDPEQVRVQFDAVKRDVYRARNQRWLADFLNAEFPPGKPIPKAEREFAKRARNTDVMRPYFAWVMRSLRNELHNIRFNDDLVTDPDQLLAADPLHGAKKRVLSNILTA